MSDQLYINFDEYIRQGEPAQRERADAWRVAIGLQAVDGLKTSEYLHQTARRNIEGEITITFPGILQGSPQYLLWGYRRYCNHTKKILERPIAISPLSIRKHYFP